MNIERAKQQHNKELEEKEEEMEELRYSMQKKVSLILIAKTKVPLSVKTTDRLEDRRYSMHNNLTIRTVMYFVNLNM